MYLTPGLAGRHGGAFVRLLVFLVVLAGVLTAAWIFFMPLLLTSTLSKRSGFAVTVQRLTLNPFSAEVDVHGLVIQNPHTFHRADYMSVPTFHAKAPIRTLWSDMPVFDHVRIDVDQITFVRNTDGTLNASLFYDRLFPPVKETPSRPEPPRKPGEKATKKLVEKPRPEEERPQPRRTAFLIRRLELRLQKVVTDDRFGRTPTSKEFNLGIDQVYSDVTDPSQLLTPAVVRALSPVATAITGLIPGTLGDALNQAVDTPPGKNSKRRAAPDVMKTISDTLEESRKP